MSTISHLGSIMNMMGMSKDLLPATSTTTVAHPAGGSISSPSSNNFDADFLSLSPMANMLQQLNDMDTKESGDGGEVDLGSLANLKQRGEMLAQMLSMKLKNFEGGLASSLKNAGLNPNQDMSMTGGDDGMSLLNDLQGNSLDKNAIETHLNGNDKLQSQFKDIAQMAKLLEMIEQTGAGSRAGRPGPPGTHTAKFAASPAAQYAEQAKPVEKKAEASFVLNVMSGSASYSFE